MATKDDKIECKLDGALCHSIKMHLNKNHPEVSEAQYAEQFPGEPLLSPYAVQLYAEAEAKKAAESGTVATPAAEAKPAAALAMATAAEPKAASVATLIPRGTITREPFHEVFGLGKVKAALAANGDEVKIVVLSDHAPADQAMVPKKNDTYVYDIDELKNVILGMDLSIPTYVWGHKGSGKSELFEQICARTNRPQIRIQHSGNTEESHIVGQWTVKGGETVFELGPLPLAMKNGWVYVADEYDFAMPSVLSVYQAVLEGKALIIKEADAANRIIEPHPNFRIVATGNTNGSGDESGLYQGTNLQNSANYDRFGMVVHKKYMDKKAESLILQRRLKMAEPDADKMVSFAALVREGYDGGKISETISPRTLIYAATIGIKRGSFMQGITLSFINKLTRIDSEAVKGMAERIFGK
jgi:cobaltochelatase CobS